MGEDLGFIPKKTFFWLLPKGKLEERYELWKVICAPRQFVVFLQVERSKLKRFETQGSGPICGKVIEFQENGNAANFSEMYLSQPSNVLQYIGCKFLWNFVLHQEGCHCPDCSAIFSEPSEFALSTFPEGRMKKIGFTFKCIFLNFPAWCIRNKSKGKNILCMLPLIGGLPPILTSFKIISS